MALVPDDVRALTSRGWLVGVEAGAGARCLIPDDAFADAGARLVPEAWNAPVVAIASAPTLADVMRMRPGSVLVLPAASPRRPCVAAGLAARDVTVVPVEGGDAGAASAPWDLEVPSALLSRRVASTLPAAARSVQSTPSVQPPHRVRRPGREPAAFDAGAPSTPAVR